MQSLWDYRSLGQRMSPETTPEYKSNGSGSNFRKGEKETRYCDWRCRAAVIKFFRYFGSKSSCTWTDIAWPRREQRQTLLEEARWTKFEEQSCETDCEVMLNSSPRRGITDTGACEDDDGCESSGAAHQWIGNEAGSQPSRMSWKRIVPGSMTPKR